MGRFTSRNFQKDYEEEVSLDQRGTITFDKMVDALKKRYKPTKNTTLSNFEFHKLEQKNNESFDLRGSYSVAPVPLNQNYFSHRSEHQELVLSCICWVLSYKRPSFID